LLFAIPIINLGSRQVTGHSSALKMWVELGRVKKMTRVQLWLRGMPLRNFATWRAYKMGMIINVQLSTLTANISEIGRDIENWK